MAKSGYSPAISQRSSRRTRRFLRVPLKNQPNQWYSHPSSSLFTYSLSPSSPFPPVFSFLPLIDSLFSRLPPAPSTVQPIAQHSPFPFPFFLFLLFSFPSVFSFLSLTTYSSFILLSVGHASITSRSTTHHPPSFSSFHFLLSFSPFLFSYLFPFLFSFSFPSPLPYN
jgi:hypothetical protein